MTAEHLEYELRTADGVELAGQAWMPPDLRAVVALVHGLAEHSGRYAFLAGRANQRGLGVVSADLRGHGRSPGERSYVERFDDYLLDADALLLKARELAAGRPVFLMGHSMGGAIALRWMAQYASARRGTPMPKAIAMELLEAYNNQGNVIKKRDDTHKMAQANRAFAHFRF